MRATISTAPTPFDSCTKEELHYWLSDPVTQRLVTSIKQNIATIDQCLTESTHFGTVEQAGRWYLDMRQSRAAQTLVLDWIQGANRA